MVKSGEELYREGETRVSAAFRPQQPDGVPVDSSTAPDDAKPADVRAMIGFTKACGVHR